MTTLIVIGATLLVYLARKHWLAYHVDSYNLKAAYYMWRTNQAGLRDEFSQLWPRSYLWFEWWRWDFRRYIVNQDLYDQMEDLMGVELQRNDLTDVWLTKEFAKTMEAARPTPTKSEADEGDTP